MVAGQLSYARQVELEQIKRPIYEDSSQRGRPILVARCRKCQSVSCDNCNLAPCTRESVRPWGSQRAYRCRVKKESWHPQVIPEGSGPVKGDPWIVVITGPVLRHSLPGRAAARRCPLPAPRCYRYRSRLAAAARWSCPGRAVSSAAPPAKRYRPCLTDPNGWPGYRTRTTRRAPDRCSWCAPPPDWRN